MASKVRYVPPSQRSARVQPTQTTEIDYTDLESFPQFGITQSTTEWTKKTFTDTIHTLIALEQRTAEEREAAEDEARRLHGTRVLVYPSTPQDWISLQDRLHQHEERTTAIQERQSLGLHETAPYVSVTLPHEIPELIETQTSLLTCQPVIPFLDIQLKQRYPSKAYQRRVALLQRKRTTLCSRKE